MREGITTDYADGFRAGWRAAIEAAAREAEIMEGIALRDEYLGHEAASEIRSRMLDLEPPAPVREPTGLEIRGG